MPKSEGEISQAREQLAWWVRGPEKKSVWLEYRELFVLQPIAYKCIHFGFCHAFFKLRVKQGKLEAKMYPCLYKA